MLNGIDAESSHACRFLLFCPVSTLKGLPIGSCQTCQEQNHQYYIGKRRGKVSVQSLYCTVKLVSHGCRCFQFFVILVSDDHVVLSYRCKEGTAAANSICKNYPTAVLRSFHRWKANRRPKPTWQLHTEGIEFISSR